jgi:hypothetical protein
MENVLQKLEKSKFISNIYKKALTVDSIDFMQIIKENKVPKDIQYGIKQYHPSKTLTTYLDLKIKFSIISSGFYKFMMDMLSSNNKQNLMISCNVVNKFTLLAYKDQRDTQNVKYHALDSNNTIPIHHSIINLDYDKKIHILLYDNNFKLPGYSLS